MQPTPSSGPPPEAHDPYAALRVPDYRLLLSMVVLNGIAGEMQAAAVGWEIYQRTGDPLDLGYTGLAQFLPVLLLTLPAGHVADRFSRKRILLCALGTMVATSLALAALSWQRGPIFLIYLLLVVAGCARAFGVPARVALLSQLVPTRLLGNATTWNSSGWQVAAVSGPALGGLVLGWASPAIVYLLSACCALVCVGLIAATRPRPATPTAMGASLHALLAGVRFVWRTDLLLAAITLDLFAVLLGGATALLPVFARDVLFVGPVGFGWLRAAPAMGAVVMALVMAHRPPLRHPGRAMLACVGGFGLTMIGFGLSEDALLSFVLLALSGALDNVSVVVRGTLIQVLPPDALRGRVAAVNAVFITCSNELGAFESGMAAALLGTVPSVVLGGVGTLVVVLISTLRWPQLLRLGPLHRIGQPAQPATPLPEAAHPSSP